MQQQGYNLSRLKILVVEDNKNMRVMIRAMLEAFGVKNIRECENTKDAWERILEFGPDIMILDWMLTPEDGIAFAKRLRTAEDSPNRFLPIVMLTGYTETRHVMVARDAGINEYLVKPVSGQALYGRIIMAIEHPRPFVRAKGYFGPDRRRHRKKDYDGPERRKPDDKDKDD